MFFSININAFPDIDSAGFKVKSDYDLSLRWYDPRLKFQDLNNLTEYNDLGPADKTFLWSPRLEISNALGESVSPGSLVDEASSVRVIKEELEAMPEDFSLDREGNSYFDMMAQPLVFIHKPWLSEHIVGLVKLILNKSTTFQQKSSRDGQTQSH